MRVCALQEMTEEQELALALQMSLQGAGMSSLLEQAMETETSGTAAADGGEVSVHPSHITPHSQHTHTHTH